MRRTLIVAVLLSALAFTATAQAEKRVALVIGNGAYEATPTRRATRPPSGAASRAFPAFQALRQGGSNCRAPFPAAP